MTRVMHIRSSAGFFGAERMLTTLLPALNRCGIGSRLAVLEHPAGRHVELLERARDAGMDTVTIPCNGRISALAAQVLREEVSRFRPDLIHTHDYKSHFYGWRVSGSTGAERLPLVTTLHGWTRSSMRLRAYEKLEPLALRSFDAVVTVSEDMADRLGHPYVRTIGNSVDMTRFRPYRRGAGRAALGFAQDAFVFGTVSRLTGEKGHADLIEAFAAVLRQIPEAGLLIVGDGPERAALEALAMEKGCSENIRFAGEREDVEYLLHDLDCYVSPSHTEGMPMIVLEAMASGIPVIATRVGAVPDLLMNGAGVLTEAGRPGVLAERMRQAAKGRLPLRRLAEMALIRCQKRYGVARQAAEYSALYQEVLDRRVPITGRPVGARGKEVVQ